MSRFLTESQAHADFSQMIADACNGEEIIITPNNKPTMHLKLVAAPVTKKDIERKALIKKREKAIAALAANIDLCTALNEKTLNT